MIVEVNAPLHEKQQYIIDNRKRFNTLRCGRRFGKSTLGRYLCIESAILQDRPTRTGFFAPTYRDLNNTFIDLQKSLAGLIERKDEQQKIIYLANNSVIDFWSTDNPDTSRGNAYHRVILDEAEKMPKLEQTWLYTVRPTLADYRGDGYLLSTGKGTQTYFNQLTRKNEPDWAHFEFPTHANPHIPLEELEELKKLPSHVYAQEILGKAVDIAEKRWLYAFNYSKHVNSDAALNPDLFLYLCFDFNVDPFVCILRQHYTNSIGIKCIRFVGEIAIPSGASLTDMCNRIQSAAPINVKNKTIRITGDPTENKRNLIDIRNSYQIICDNLGLTWKYIDLPKITNNQKNRILCNSIFENMDILINPSCEQLIYDCEFVQADNYGNKKKVNRNDPSQRADAMDAMSYSFDAYDWDFL
jgi:hypothetical protein